MSVYVDPLFRLASRDPQAFKVGLRNGHRRCHMFCDQSSIASLHAIAGHIGMRMTWFQNKPGFPHYDLTPAMRERAIQKGAVPLTHQQMLEKLKDKYV